MTKTICVFVEVNEDLEVVDVDVDTFDNEEVEDSELSELFEDDEVDGCEYCGKGPFDCVCEFCPECGELLE